MARPHGLGQDRLSNYTIVVITKKFHSWPGNIYMILYEIYVWAQPTGISAVSTRQIMLCNMALKLQTVLSAISW